MKLSDVEKVGALAEELHILNSFTILEIQARIVDYPLGMMDYCRGDVSGLGVSWDTLREELDSVVRKHLDIRKMNIKSELRQLGVEV